MVGVLPNSIFNTSDPTVLLAEGDLKIVGGYNFPITDGMGLGVEIIYTGTDNRGYDGPAACESCPLTLKTRNDFSVNGVILDWGWEIADWLSIGLGVGGFGRLDNFASLPFNYTAEALSVCAGLCFMTTDRTFVYSTLLGWNSTFNLVANPGIPIFWENSFSLSFNQKYDHFICERV
jgi:hypothetical protein